MIVVTGATSGIGRATAARLVAEGATVVGVARDEARLAAAERAFGRGAASGAAGRAPGSFVPAVCDLADPRARAALVGGVLDRHGRIDALVNNAGVGWQGMVAQMGRDDLERLYATNVLGALDLTRLVLPGMLARRSGDIVMITSVLSWLAAPPLTVYASTKAALEVFADGLRREVWRQGVRVHIVRPGPVATEFMARSVHRPLPGRDDSPPATGRAAGTGSAAGTGRAPATGSAPATSPGIRPARVAAAVERSLRAGYPRRETVPRFLSATQAVRVQPLRAVADVVAAAGVTGLLRTGQVLAGSPPLRTVGSSTPPSSTTPGG